MIPTIQSNTGPIRYAAREHPATWIENLEAPGTVAVAAMYMPIQNEYLSHIQDGIYIEIERFPKGDYLADCYMVEPNRKRQQHCEKERFETYEQAKAYAAQWMEQKLQEHEATVSQHYPQLYDTGQLTLF